MAPMAPMGPMPRMSFGYTNEDFSAPRPVLNQGAPEDSLYSLAHEMLGRGEYGRAAAMFKDIAQKYPTSIYKDDLAYYDIYPSMFALEQPPHVNVNEVLVRPTAQP